MEQTRDMGLFSNRSFPASISRFSRNTVECREYLKKLKDCGVSVWFEKEGLDSLDPRTDMILSMGRTPVVWEGFGKAYNDRIDRRTLVIAWESYYQPAYDLAAAGFTLINCSWKPLYIVTPSTCWSPEEIAAHDPWRWDHWWEKSVAYPDGYRIDRKYPVLGSQLCAWGDRIAGWEDWEEGIRQERELVAERLPALCNKLWHLDS